MSEIQLSEVEAAAELASQTLIAVWTLSEDCHSVSDVFLRARKSLDAAMAHVLARMPDE